GAAWRIRPLRRQDPEIVAVVGRRTRTRSSPPVALSARARGERTERALRRVRGAVPVQPVSQPGSALDLLRIFQNSAAIVRLPIVLPLGIDVGQAGLDDAQFVLADAPVQDLVLPGAGVEIPLPFRPHDRDGHWPVVLAHEENGLVVAL